MSLQAKVVRIKAEVGSNQAPIDVYTNETPQSWRSNDVNVQFGIFLNSVVQDLSNIVSATLVLKSSQRATDEYCRKTVLAADFATITSETWAAKTAQHFTVNLSSVDLNIAPDTADTDKSVWFCLFLLTNDATAKEITVAAGTWLIVEDGSGSAGETIPSNPTYYPASDSDARYVQKHADQAWTQFYSGRWYHYIASTGLWYPEVATIKDGVPVLTLGEGVSL